MYFGLLLSGHLQVRCYSVQNLELTCMQCQVDGLAQSIRSLSDSSVLSDKEINDLAHSLIDNKVCSLEVRRPA